MLIHPHPLATPTLEVPALPCSANTPKGIIALIELVQTLQKTGRRATIEELDLLASWRGWGPIAPAFEYRPKDKWVGVAAQLRMLLGPDGMQEASAATPTSFFTNPLLTKTTWKIATGLGFAGGRVLEPGCGSGAFLENAPTGMTLDFTGIEREPFTASLAQLRFPKATIVNQPFEKVVLVNDSFDLVVGNVPFSSVQIRESETKAKLSLHNYFLYRALRALHPGGLALLLTSRYLMDAQNDYQRELIDHLGILMGAFRIPSGILDHTEVITDLVLFQRRSSTLPYEGQPWMHLSDEVVPGLPINEYYAHHGENMLGIASLGHGMYGNNELLLKEPVNFAKSLSYVVEDMIQSGVRYEAPRDLTDIPEELVHIRSDGRKEGSYHCLTNGQLIQIVNGNEEPVTKMAAELSALIGIRDTIAELLDAERDLDRPDADITPIRERLNVVYDEYVKTYGPIHRAKIIEGEVDPETGERRITRRRPLSMSAFAKDPDYCMVLGLEHYDDETGVAQKASIFTERIHVRARRKEHADSPAEALSLCLDECGRLDLARIAALLSLSSETQVIEALGDLVYLNPETDEWELAASYLSGNVRTKLVAAQRLLESGETRFSRNVEALTKVQPEDLAPEEIKALLGASWIPIADIEQFCSELLNQQPTIHYNRVMGTWTLTPPYGVAFNALAVSEWGTERVNAFRLIELGLNKTIPIVYDQVDDTTRVKNINESLAAQDKLQSIQNRFSEWIWQDDQRAERLAKIYNDLFNSVVPRTYDGSHLTFPGMSAYWQEHLYPWQKDFIYQMICNPSALCAHPVGAGKTTTEIAGAMTLRRLGLIQKAAVVVPNHLLEQITAEAQRLYPGANILMVSSDDLRAEKRKLFATRIATGNYDLVVMTHSGFGLLGVHPDTERAFIERKVAVFRTSLEETERDDRKSIKKLETAIEKMRQRQTELMKKPHDGGVTFEQLGISYLIIDEFHLYKNLGLPTNINGLSVTAAQRSIDLEMKFRWLEEHNQGKPFGSGFTATPISNSMVEAYVMLWYLNQRLLHSSGLLTLDAFASLFIEFQTRVEVSPNGASFRLHTRPSNFVNLPEFMTLFAQVCDIRSTEILSSKRPDARKRTTVIDPSPEIVAYVDTLVSRSEAIHNGHPQMIDGREDNMLWVTTHGRMAALDLSLVGVEQDSSPKLEAVVHNMVEIYQRWQKDAAFLDGEFKSLQIGFCDIGTPSEEKGDQIYGKLRMLLEIAGIPRHGIRFIHHAKTPAEKAALFEQCRIGKVAILLGSTGKMGTGTNIQTRCAALHHIDAPWRPDEVEQREGRCQRPGNLWKEVEIFYYVVKRTFDAYSWQTLSNKAVFFDQLRSGVIKNRELAQGENALSYGQVKAAATGDPLVLEQAELGAAIAQLKRLQSMHARARRRDLQLAEDATRRATFCVSLARIYEQMMDIMEKSEQKGFVSSRGEVLAERAVLGDYIAESIVPLIHRGWGTTPIGTWSSVPVKSKVQVVNNGEYLVLLLIGANEDTPVRLHVYPTWLNEGQHWRFVQAIEQFFTTLPGKRDHEQQCAEEEVARANAFRQQAEQRFGQREELETRCNRKRELDAYTALVASSKDDPEKMAIAAIKREQLLADAPVLSDVFSSSSVPVKVQGPVAPKLTLDDLPSVVVTSSLVFGSSESIAILKQQDKKRKKGGKRETPSTTRYAMPALPGLWEEQDLQVEQVSLWG